MRLLKKKITQKLPYICHPRVPPIFNILNHLRISYRPDVILQYFIQYRFLTKPHKLHVNIKTRILS